MDPNASGGGSVDCNDILETFNSLFSAYLDHIDPPDANEFQIEDSIAIIQF